MDNKKLRQDIREKRRGLSSEQQDSHAQQLSCSLIKHLPCRAKRIALYLASDGEINPMPFIEYCWNKNIEVYLPVLHPFCQGHLLFLRYLPSTKMTINKYGISEPMLNVTLVCPANQLDIIYTPLVAFDQHGNRLGMGGGYYDRTLAATPDCVTIGLAHDEQQIEKLIPQSWDQGLDYIITPTQRIKSESKNG